MTIHIWAPLNNGKIHNAVDGANQYLNLVACPECSMAATLQWANRVESTDGPVDHVRVTCVNRHWFLMPADTLTERTRITEAGPTHPSSGPPC